MSNAALRDPPARTTAPATVLDRSYDPTTGTFLSPDPLAAEPYGAEEATTTVANAYHYVSNDPLNFTDPLGLCRTTDVEFQIPGDSGADVEVLTGPDGGYTYDQCKNSAAVDCTSPTPIVEGDAYIPTGNASAWCRPHVSGNGGKWNWTRPGSGPGCLQWDFWNCDMTRPQEFLDGFVECGSFGLAGDRGGTSSDAWTGGCVTGAAAAVLGVYTYAGVLETLWRTRPGAPPAADGPKPPGWGRDWEWLPASRESVDEWHWYDPRGGEWRWHDVDAHHPTPHCDYNPWTSWNSPWQHR